MSDQPPTAGSGSAPAVLPIQVNPSAVPDQVESQIGPLVAAAGGVILAFGWLSPVKEAALAGFVPVALVSVWRLYRATHRHAQRVVMATAAPDSVAVVSK